MLEITPIIDYLGLYLSFDYSFMNIIENRLSKYEIIKKQFSTDVTFIVRVPKDEVTGVCNQLISMTNNLIKIRILKNDDEEKIE